MSVFFVLFFSRMFFLFQLGFSMAAWTPGDMKHLFKYFSSGHFKITSLPGKHLHHFCFVITAETLLQ